MLLIDTAFFSRILYTKDEVLSFKDCYIPKASLWLFRYRASGSLELGRWP